MALVVSNWFNHHFHYKEGKAKDIAPRKRFRYPDRFPEGAKAYIWPIQVAWLSNIQQSVCKTIPPSFMLILVQSYWQTQVRQFGTAAFHSPRIVGRCVNKGSDEEGNIYVNAFGPDYKDWINVEEGKGLRVLPRPEYPENATELQK